jgi:hypothetical protein
VKSHSPKEIAMKKLYLATTLVSVAIIAGSVIPPNKTTHKDIVWAVDEEDARRILTERYSKDTVPELTTISIWLTEALGNPLSD